MTEHRSKVGDGKTDVARRWIWELIQNAKDVHNGRVKIRIEFTDEGENTNVTFKHNGAPFTTNNIRYLIEQISDKDQKKNQGERRILSRKFGTGFLTTHLLSEIVTVTGIAKEPELSHRQFTVKLDRSGTEIDDIIESVERSKESVEDMDSLPEYKNYVEGKYNTTFYYPLNDNVGINVAAYGLNDLKYCLPYTLVFVPEIHVVESPSLNLLFQNASDVDDEEELVELVDIIIEPDDELPDVFTIAKLRRGFTTLAIPVQRNQGQVSILRISEKVPKLFCDFPLVGAESFPFPVIINNPNFNPTDPRNGIFLTAQSRANERVAQNKSIMEEAVELYFQLLKHAADNKWSNLYLLAQITEYNNPPEWLDKTWFNNDVVTPIRKRLLRTEIVNTSDNNIVAILDEKGDKYTWFPSAGKKEIREAIWRCATQWFPYLLPRKEDVELWYRLSWKECGTLTLDQMAHFVEQMKTLDALKDELQHDNVYDWLNEFYDLLRMDEKEYATIIQKRAIFPNQNGDFRKKSILNEDAGDIGDDFKDILKLLGTDIREKLSDVNLQIEFEVDDVFDQAYVVKEITSEVTEIANDRERAKNYSEAFAKLLSWFHNNPKKAASLFSQIYRQKHLLYDEEEIMENFSKAEQLKEIMEALEVENMDELRQLLNKGKETKKSLLPVTEKILSSMGITSVEEWEKAIEDKDLAEMYSHESVPTTDMFVRAQAHIAKAKHRIIEHLQTLQDYDLSMVEETAPTLLAGVVKDSREITIVTRPAFNGEVIIYYGSERDILDYEPASELWVDDGKEVRQISLGHILKSSGIVKFPI